jgi:hypothetical protein
LLGKAVGLVEGKRVDGTIVGEVEGLFVGRFDGVKDRVVVGTIDDGLVEGSLDGVFVGISGK